MRKYKKQEKKTINTIVKIYDPYIQGNSMIYNFYINMSKS